MGLVELATVSFGQSFQITPLQLITTVSSLINGGTRVTPHFGIRSVSADGESVHTFTYPVKEGIISAETSETVRYLLEQVVAEAAAGRRPSRDIGSAAKQPPLKNFREALRNTFPVS